MQSAGTHSVTTRRCGIFLKRQNRRLKEMGETAGLRRVKLPGTGRLGAGEHNWCSLTGVQETSPAHRLVSALQSLCHEPTRPRPSGRGAALCGALGARPRSGMQGKEGSSAPHRWVTRISAEGPLELLQGSRAGHCSRSALLERGTDGAGMRPRQAPGHGERCSSSWKVFISFLLCYCSPASPQKK